MSWTSRFRNLGQFSPFMRSPQGSGSDGPAKVSDADFSYITAEDLRKHEAASVSAVTDSPRSHSPVDYGPQRETDVIVLRNKKKDYHVHFAAYSIAKGELVIGQIRETAAKKMTGGDKSRVKLLFKGKNLKDDERTAKQEGLKDWSEILCTVTEIDPQSDGESDDDEGEEGVEGDEDSSRKRRNRGKKTKRRNKREAATANSGTSTPDRSNLQAGVPLSQTSTRTGSPTPKSPPTAIDKLNALRETLQNYRREVDGYLRDPPAEAAKRDFEYKRLSETIMREVLLKLDGVETEGDADARTRRKELVKETQAVLNELDRQK